MKGRNGLNPSTLNRTFYLLLRHWFKRIMQFSYPWSNILICSKAEKKRSFPIKSTEETLVNILQRLVRWHKQFIPSTLLTTLRWETGLQEWCEIFITYEASDLLKTWEYENTKITRKYYFVNMLQSLIKWRNLPLNSSSENWLRKTLPLYCLWWKYSSAIYKKSREEKKFTFHPCIGRDVLTVYWNCWWFEVTLL